MSHEVYEAIVKTIKEGRLIEPFSWQDFNAACPGFAEGTYKAFLYKHKVGNDAGTSELFEQVGKNNFVAVRPFKYGL